ncbi:FGGY-family carbohydrate kinase [Gammaproteobacteria bacterium]|nr:FGGY-family carbohydrate kinase [Gammaproteobacteria bacterium]MDC0090432.1 FGGY-family carbohydrate kinase [Gammaproteobacteria bacterium]
MKEQYFLSIDNGTQSVRAIVFDGQGQLIAKSKIDIEPYFSNQKGWAEQHADYFWDSLCQACQELWLKLPIPKESIVAVSVTTQRATVVPMGKDNQPLRPAISWLDQRQVETKPKLGKLESALMSLIRAKPLVDLMHSQAEANWIEQNEPDIWQQVHKFLLLSGYHNYKLTGQYNDAIASSVGFVPFEYKTQQWADEKDWKWRAMPIRSEMLPKVSPAGSVLGEITAAAADATGIPEGLPLIASGSDKACEVLGTGCIDNETGSLSYGSLATLNITSDKYLEAIPFYPAYPGVIPNTFNIEMMVQRGYWMVSWFKKEFGLQEEQSAANQDLSPESLFDELLAKVPAGCEGLMLQPYWSPSNGDGPETRGAVIGFNEDHTRAHLYRAMIEGLTYALREGKELLEKKSGKPISRLVVSGGGSQSDQIMQITADIFGMTVLRPHTFETSSLGAAIASAVGIGLYPDFSTAVDKMTHSGDSFEPIDANKVIYSDLYYKVYKKMYGQLKPSYEAIHSITKRSI